MSPFVRGRILAETKSTGRAKSALDVLLWLPQITDKELAVLDSIDVLRAHLNAIAPIPCSINLWVPSAFAKTMEALSAFAIRHKPIPVARSDRRTSEILSGAPQELVVMAATGLSVDSDVVVISHRDWLPYVLEFEQLNMLLADCDILPTQCEIFVRGHDVPWSFGSMIWNQAWTVFYQLSELRTFQEGVAFLDHCHKKKVDAETFDIARMLIHNRLPNLCFTRDRLLFYDMQQAAAKRAGWERQEFLFEAAYYLNFYYMLIHGGFDHLALVVNGALQLGLPPKNVGATYQSFLKALAGKAPEIHALFTAPNFCEFQERIAAVRHFAAHRGSVMPGTIYERPEHEPTIQELDEEIERQGLDTFLRSLPAGTVRDTFRENLRFKIRLSKYKKAAEGIVPLDVKGKHYFIRPMNDIEWNFTKLFRFMVRVLTATQKRL